MGAPDEAVVKAGIEEFAATASVLEQSLGTKEYLCGAAHDRRLRPGALRRPRRELRPRLRALPEGEGVARAHAAARDSMKKTLAAAREAA